MTSMKILEEVTRRSGGVKLREDNVLFMLSNRLKDLCNKYGIFILTATQLNGSFREEKVPDQNLLRGSKSIADRLTHSLSLIKKLKKKKSGTAGNSLNETISNLAYFLVRKLNDYPLWSNENEVRMPNLARVWQRYSLVLMAT